MCMYVYMCIYIYICIIERERETNIGAQPIHKTSGRSGGGRPND